MPTETPSLPNGLEGFFLTVCLFMYKIFTYHLPKTMKTILEIRKEIGMTQSELAKRLDISRMTLYSYEKRKVIPKYTMLLAIAHIFGVPVTNIEV